MNGRLRQIHIPPKYGDTIPEIQRLKRTFSLVPTTLPSGLIITYEVEIGGSDNGDDADADHPGSFVYNESPIPKMIHRIKGETIIDHCWTVVKKQKHGKEHNDESHCDDRDNDEYYLILAVLTRLSREQRFQGKQDISPCTVFIYCRQIQTQQSARCDGGDISQEFEQKSSNFHNYSIDCESEQNDDDDDPQNNPCIWSSTHKIKSLNFATCIAMDDNILVIGSYVGATIYKVQDILYHSKSTGVLKNRNENGTKRHEQVNHQYFNCHEEQKESVSKCDSNGKKHDELIPSVRIMKSCIVQAMYVLYPFFAAATGDRIGIWGIDDIINSIDDDYINKVHKNNDDNYADITVVENEVSSKKVTALWHSKVDNGQSRITCIDMIHCDVNGYYLALSCWDGSAFVFHRKHNAASNVDDENNVYNKHCSDGDDKNEWIHVQPLSSWESPDLNADVVFPTFCKLLIAPKPDQSIGMAVSCPGISLIKYHNIATTSGGELLHQDTISLTKPRKDSEQVNGLLGFKRSRRGNASIDPNINLISVDEKDRIHYCIC